MQCAAHDDRLHHFPRDRKRQGSIRSHLPHHVWCIQLWRSLSVEFCACHIRSCLTSPFSPCRQCMGSHERRKRHGQGSCSRLCRHAGKLWRFDQYLVVLVVRCAQLPVSTPFTDNRFAAFADPPLFPPAVSATVSTSLRALLSSY